MLNNVTWSQYWLSIFLASLLYYACVWIRYYRPVLHGRYEEKPPDTSAEQALRLPAGQEIYAYLSQAAYQKPARNEVIYALQQLLRRHGSTLSPEEKMVLTDWIRILCKDKCAVSLSDEEMKQVWLV